MKVQILELIEGAKKAEGLAVVIDVFRAYSLECYLFAEGVEKIYPVASLEEAFALKREHPDSLLIGERGGAKVEGCDYGNSPSSFRGMDLTGRCAIRSTSAGTQGLDAAARAGAGPVLSASLVNAGATAEWILKHQPEQVSLLAMGNAGIKTAREDVLCAEYIRSILLGKPVTDIADRAAALRFNGGEHFFDRERQHIFPEEDFFACTRVDCFDFVIRTGTDEEGRRVNTAHAADEP